YSISSRHNSLSHDCSSDVCSSYLFKNPFFISLDPDAQPGSIRLQGMRIGLNGRELEEGQAYARLDATITNASYGSTGQTLSTFRSEERRVGTMSTTNTMVYHVNIL